ncbi:MAG: hypothetical protein AAFU72_09155 [Pseudomonadota bacterium]
MRERHDDWLRWNLEDNERRFVRSQRTYREAALAYARIILQSLVTLYGGSLLAIPAFAGSFSVLREDSTWALKSGVLLIASLFLIKLATYFSMKACFLFVHADDLKMAVREDQIYVSATGKGVRSPSELSDFEVDAKKSWRRGSRFETFAEILALYSIFTYSISVSVIAIHLLL